MTIYSTIESIAAIGSTIAKQQIIEKNKSNEVLRLAFHYTEDNRYNYYIRVDEEELCDASGKRDIIVADLQIFADLDARKVTGNDARLAFQGVLLPLSKSARTIMCRILNRDLRCKAGTAITNKVWPGLISEMPCMLAGKFDAKAIKTIVPKRNGYIVQLKADGSRALVEVKSDGSVVARSRGGNVVELYGLLDEQFKKYKGMVFDGELLVKCKDGVEDRKTSNGFFTKAVRGTITKAEASRFHYVVWDIIPADEFYTGVGTTPYTGRLEQLIKITEKTNTNVVSLIETKVVSSIEEVQDFYGQMIARGEEGAILKFADSVWEDKRSKKMLKLKLVNSADLIVVGTEEGAGKYKGMLGNLICETSDGLLRVNIGSGFKDSDRDPSIDWAGKIVEAEYNEVITSKNKALACLFLPIYKQVRIDKKSANKLSELK